MKPKTLFILLALCLLSYLLWPVVKPYLGYNANELIVEVEKPLEQCQLSIETGFFSDLKASKEDLLRKKQFLVYDGNELQQIRNDYGENDFLLKYADTCYVLFRHNKTNNKQRDSYHFQVYKKGANIYLKASIEGTDPRSFTCVFKSIEKLDGK